jgi:hypothetical protein
VVDAVDRDFEAACERVREQDDEDQARDEEFCGMMAIAGDDR